MPYLGFVLGRVCPYLPDPRRSAFQGLAAQLFHPSVMSHRCSGSARLSRAARMNSAAHWGTMALPYPRSIPIRHGACPMGRPVASLIVRKGLGVPELSDPIPSDNLATSGNVPGSTGRAFPSVHGSQSAVHGLFGNPNCPQHDLASAAPCSLLGP